MAAWTSRVKEEYFDRVGYGKMLVFFPYAFPENTIGGNYGKLTIDLFNSQWETTDAKGITVNHAIIDDEVMRIIARFMNYRIAQVNLFYCTITPTGLNYILTAADEFKRHITVEFVRLFVKSDTPIIPRDFFQGETDTHQMFFKTLHPRRNCRCEPIDGACQCKYQTISLDWAFREQKNENLCGHLFRGEDL